jgi:ribosomal protein S27E
MAATDPYKPPQTPLDSSTKSGPPLPNGWVPCPGCEGTDVTMPSFTWWGGAIGQRILSHVKCNDCGQTFNAKSGKSNTPAIIAYQVVGLLIGVGIYIALTS